MRNVGLLLTVSSITTMGMLADVAAAQTGDSVPRSASPGISTPTPAGEDQVGDIVVTAQRRDERLQQVPISITALDSQALARNRVTDVSRLEQVTPGFTFGRSGSDARPSIRGVRTETVSAPNDPTIGFYLDGVYQSRAQQALIPLVDLSRVEVQRGPQGTLYGRNTFGGNISVVTNAPSSRLEGGASATVSNFGTQQITAYTNLPVNNVVQLRFAGIYNHSNGFVTSTANPAVRLFDRNEYMGRVAARIAPTDDLEIVLRAGYWHNDGQGGGAYGYRVSGTLVNPATGLRSVTGVPVAFNPTVRDGIPDVAGIDVGVPITGGKYTNNWDQVSFERTHEFFSSAQINWTVGSVVLRSITGYETFRTDRSADLDQTSVVFPAPGISSGFAASGYQRNDTNAKTFSQEFQIASRESRPLQLIVGLFGIRDRLDEPYSQIYTSPTATVADTLADTRLNVDAYAAYAQASYFILPDRLRLTGGVRYTNEEKKFTISNFSYPRAGGTIVGAASSGDPHYKKVNYKAGADFFITPDNMIYASFTTGFRSGGIHNNSTNALIPASFGPENVNAWEIGAKNRFLNGKLQLNVSAFDYRFKDLQITILDQTTNLSYTQNAGRAHSRGFDVTLEAVPTRGLHLNGSVTRLQAVFDQYVRPNDFYSTTNGDPRLVNFAGNMIPMSPKWKFTGNAYYEIDAGDAGTFVPLVSWLRSSSYYTLDYNTVLDRQRAYDKIDARLTWQMPRSPLEFELFVENLTNVAVLNRSVVGNSQRIQQSFQPPRTYGGRVSFAF